MDDMIEEEKRERLVEEDGDEVSTTVPAKCTKCGGKVINRKCLKCGGCY